MNSTTLDAVVPSRPMTTGGRDRLVDMLRGLALVLIVIDHVNLIARDIGDIGGLRLYLLIDVQLADAAEVFVFLSGYVFGLVHGSPGRRLGPSDLARRTLRRILQIFSAYALTVIVVAALYVWLDGAGAIPARWAAASQITMLDQPGLGLLSGMIGLTVTVFFVNILHLYILLLAFGLPMLLFWHRLPWAAVAVSAAIWLVAQTMDPASMPRWAGMRAFNPLAWQLLFCAGMFLGTHRFLDRIRNRPQKPWLALAVGVVAVAAVLRAAIAPVGAHVFPASLIEFARLVALTAKPVLGPARLIDFAALVYLAWTLMPPAARLDRWGPARLLATLGSHSLEMFCVGTVLIMLASLALNLAGGGGVAYALVVAVTLAAYALAGQIGAWLLAKPSRAPAAAPMPPARS